MKIIRKKFLTKQTILKFIWTRKNSQENSETKCNKGN